MDFLINYWWTIVVGIAAIIVVVYAIYAFAKRPTSEQIQKVKEWLLYAVIEAEKELGSGTGPVKLRSVYDMFITKFPKLSVFISFNTFSEWVDVALDYMEKLLTDNKDVKAIIKG